MSNEEFSNEFDLLVSSYRRFRDFDSREPLDTIEFDEYEKSLYLTKAQESVILSLYNGRNSLGESFEQTEELRRYLEGLVVEKEIEPVSNEANEANGTSVKTGVGEKSLFFELPDDLWFIVYEQATVSDDSYCEGMGAIGVYPTRHDEYLRLRKNPFRGVNDRRALRLDVSENQVEIVSKYTISKYYVRYLRKLKPIILEDLPNEVTIGHTEGFAGNMATPCEVHESLHHKIVERAVEMALQAKLGGIPSEKRGAQ